MNREVHVRFWERAEVQFLRATRQTRNHPEAPLCQLPPAADITSVKRVTARSRLATRVACRLGASAEANEKSQRERGLSDSIPNQ